MNWKVWLLIACLLTAALIIFPLEFNSGAKIVSVDFNSTAAEAGLRAGQIITAVDGKAVKNSNDYISAISQFPTAEKTKVIITTNEGEVILFTDTVPALTVKEVEHTRIKTGLDLSGGARALVKPEMVVSQAEMQDLIAITSNRLNEFGIADVSVRAISDLSGENYMLVEIAGSTPAELENLIAQQGKFEAKIGNETVFVGGEKDITYVARSGDQAGIYTCGQLTEGGEACSFRFSIALSEAAASRHSTITCNLGYDATNPQYLEKKLDLYLDDKLIDSLYIGRDLRCSKTTQIQISGSGQGSTREEAYDNALLNMKKLQTVLITGSLPYKLEVVKIDSISPTLGKAFTENLFILGLAVFCVVSLSLFIRYRKIKLTLAVVLTMFSEAFLTLAFAALLKWNLDAPSIAGIIAGMGTGVNDQIVIIDEAFHDVKRNLKERIKSALFIILGAFFTIIAAMLPLFWAGAGMLKGFAFTTIIGVSIGILITRPAFAEIIKNILKE